MKKVLLILLLLFMFAFNVNAKEYYYSNGIVKLTKKEYDFVIEFYGKEYLNNMNEEDYEWLSKLNIENNKIEIKHLSSENIMPTSTIVANATRRVAIAASCEFDFCLIDILANWLTSPEIRSYDVIGARLDDTSLYDNSILTRTKSSAGSAIISNLQKFSNGFGSSVQVPTGNSIIIEQKFKVNKNGTVYASYQHAVKVVSLATSQKYTISPMGYGNVFTFTGSAVNCYDGFPGVYISV